MNDESGPVPPWVEPLAIVSILVCNGMVAIYQDQKAAEATSELRGLQKMDSLVKRNGIWKYIPSTDLVPGDIVQLKQGNKVHADCRLVRMKTITLTVNEQPITGVKKDVIKELSEEKHESELKSSNMLFDGSVVKSGSAIAIVCRTGGACLLSRMRKDGRADEWEDSTLLEKKLDAFGKFLETTVFYACVLIWVINFTNFNHPRLGGIFMGSIYYLKISVSLAVAALPEGLPTVITACLALGTIRLTEKKSIVKKLSSIETLGSATVICTSTIGMTVDSPTVSEFMLFGDNPTQFHRFRVNSATGKFINLSAQLRDFKNTKHFIQSLFTNNVRRFQREEEEPEKPGTQTQLSFEKSIYPFVSEFAFLSETARSKEEYLKYLNKKWSIKTTLVFDSQRKMMSTLARPQNKEANYLFIKGEPTAVLGISDRVLLKDSTLEPLEAGQKSQILDEVRKMSGRGLKVIAVAYKKDLGEFSRFDGAEDKASIALGMLKDPYNYKTVEDHCDLIGFIGIADPIRPEMRRHVAICNEAGIQIYLMIGNLREAAEAYAQELGLAPYVHVSGPQIDASGAKGLASLLRDAVASRKNAVFCSINEYQKKKVVKTLQSLGQVVVMTGKDFTDELAMAQADIPVAMGLAGTDGAVDRASLILADDNFCSIVNAIEEGRGIYENMKVAAADQAFIRYMISSNIGEVVSVFLFSLLGLPEGFSSIQLLLVNLITDGFPAVALSFNPPDEDIMLKPPRAREDGIVDSWVLVRYFSIGLYIGTATVGIFVFWYCFYVWAPDGHPLVSLGQLMNWTDCRDWQGFSLGPQSYFTETDACAYFTLGKKKASTMSLSLLIFLEMLNCWNAVSEKNSLLVTGLTSNRYLLPVTLSCLGFYLLLVYVPIFNYIFSLQPLDLLVDSAHQDWLVVLLFSLPVLFIEEYLKYLSQPARSKPKLSAAPGPTSPKQKTI